MNVVELFAGIGSQKKALTNLGIKHKVLNVAEWYIPAILAYDSIHFGKRDLSLNKDISIIEMKNYLRQFTFSMNSKKPLTKNAFEHLNENIIRNLYFANLRINNLVSIDKVAGSELPNNIDVMTYSFPCQDLSNVGAFHGYNNGIDKDKKSRSGLLWQVERLMQERERENLDLPRILLMENVSTLLAPRHNANFQEWISSLEKMGYYSYHHTLNAKDFGIPQNRKRIFMISVYIKNLSDSQISLVKSILKEKFDGQVPKKNLNEFLKTNYYGIYKKEADEAQPNDTISRKAIYDKNYYLFGSNKLRNIAEFCPTITTRQDRHPNSGVIEYNGTRNHYRFLTAREVFLLMGFTEKDYESIDQENFYRNKSSMFYSRDKYYTLAGNSIVVDVLEAIFIRIQRIYELIKVD